MNRKRHPTRRSLPQGASRADIPPMPLGDLAADSQADSGPFVFGSAVQSLEHGEDPVQVFLIKTDAVVFNHQLEHAVPSLLGTGRIREHPHPRRLSLLVELKSVSDEILQELTDLHRVSVNGGQIAY